MWPKKQDFPKTLILNTGTAQTIALEKDSISANLVNQITIVSGIFVALTPAIVIPQIRDVESCSWKSLLVVLSIIAWASLTACLLLGVSFHSTYRNAVLNNPNYHYLWLKEKLDGRELGGREIIEYDNPVYEKHRELVNRSSGIVVYQRLSFFVGISVSLITVVLVSLVAAFGW